MVKRLSGGMPAAGLVANTNAMAIAPAHKASVAKVTPRKRTDVSPVLLGFVIDPPLAEFFEKGSRRFHILDGKALVKI
jgi:hypothetical protein